MRDPQLPDRYSEALEPALTAAMHASPFFGYMLLGTGTFIRHTTLPNVRVAATDGFYIYLNEGWLNRPAVDQAFILLHEIVHIWLDHGPRCGGRDEDIWGEAIDLFTNTFVEASSPGMNLKTPPDGLEPDPKYLEMSVEEIYDSLVKKHMQSPGGGSSKKQQPHQPGGTAQNGKPNALAGDVTNLEKVKAHAAEDGYSDAGRTDAMDKENLKLATVMSEEVARGYEVPGPVGAIIGARIAELRKPKLDWGANLRRFVYISAGHKRETWERPNLYYPTTTIPTLYGGKVDRIDFFADVSGSMSPEWLNRIAGEITPLLKHCDALWVHTFDAVLRASTQVRHERELRGFEFITGAHCSTHVEGVLDYLGENCSRGRNVAIVATDGRFRCPPRPRYLKHFLWLILEEANTNQPWGIVHALPRD